MKQADPQFKLRLPADLKARLEAAAEASGLTLTGEIISRLQASFEAPDLALQDTLERELRLVRAMSARASVEGELFNLRTQLEVLKGRVAGKVGSAGEISNARHEMKVLQARIAELEEQRVILSHELHRAEHALPRR